MQEGHHVIMACRNMTRFIFSLLLRCCDCKLDTSTESTHLHILLCIAES